MNTALDLLGLLKSFFILSAKFRLPIFVDAITNQNGRVPTLPEPIKALTNGKGIRLNGMSRSKMVLAQHTLASGEVDFDDSTQAYLAQVSLLTEYTPQSKTQN